MRKVLTYIFTAAVIMLPMSAYSENILNRGFLRDVLVEKGIEISFACEILKDQQIKYDNNALILNLCNTGNCGKKKVSVPENEGFRQSKPEGPVRYVDRKYILQGLQFINHRQEIFKRVEAEYNVPSEVITAILIIESKLGKLEPKYNALNSYLNMAALTDPEFLEGFIIKNKNIYPEIDTPENRANAEKRGRWAIREILHLMKLSEELDMDPLEFKSSYAGAIGPAQFIPSSVRNYFVDGNDDGLKDPFEMEDAIASIANYLKKGGWKEDEASMKQAIWNYNHNNYYVKAVMETYRELSEALNEIEKEGFLKRQDPQAET